jgi:hypothetical protein
MTPRLAPKLAAVALLCAAAGAFADTRIISITSSAASVSLRNGSALVRFNVGGNAESRERCGYFVEYNDGMAGDSRLVENENGQFTRPHERAFNRPGTYTVQATGRSVRTTEGCEGSTSTTVVVVAEAAAAPAAAVTPACPEGWALNERSVNRRTGAYNCSAKPQLQMECGQGLQYYERGGMIGCQASRRNRRND